MAVTLANPTGVTVGDAPLIFSKLNIVLMLDPSIFVFGIIQLDSYSNSVHVGDAGGNWGTAVGAGAGSGSVFIGVTRSIDFDDPEYEE